VNDDTPAISLSAFADGELDAVQARDLSGRLAAEPVLSRVVALYKALDDAASRLPVPEVARAAAARAWRAVAQRTTEVSATDHHAFTRLEKAAAALPVPAVSNAAFRRTWDSIARRLQLGATASRRPAPSLQAALVEAQPPQPSARQWDEVWRGVALKTELGATGRPVLKGVDFSRRRSLPWRWLAAASLAAAVLLGLLAYVPRQSAEQAALGMPDSPEVPEVLDDRYQVQIKYMEGQRSPVVCFLLKDDTGLGGEKGQNWRWLPE